MAGTDRTVWALDPVYLYAVVLFVYALWNSSWSSCVGCPGTTTISQLHLAVTEDVTDGLEVPHTSHGVRLQVAALSPLVPGVDAQYALRGAMVRQEIPGGLQGGLERRRRIVDHARCIG